MGTLHRLAKRGFSMYRTIAVALPALSNEPFLYPDTVLETEVHQ